MGPFSGKNCPIFVGNHISMRIDIITILPQLLDGPFTHSIVKRAREKGLVEIHIHDLRDYALDKHRNVDDYPFGGDAGMVMSIGPIHRAISHLCSQQEYDEIIYTSPDGIRFDQKEANQLALANNLIILCGHYKGVDQRIRDHLITREISIGDYVLSGGELAAAVITDSIVRILPGAISDETSALTDSFQDGLLAPPVYTRPADYQGWKVPEILLSGHAAKIDHWKHEQSLARTQKLRPDLLKGEGE
jgi:tRNA (guanine37-N1)-methyltransferase